MNTHLGFELKFAFGYSIVGFGGVYTGKGYLLPWTYGREGRGIAVERDLVRVFLIRVLDYSTDQVHRSKKKKSSDGVTAEHLDTGLQIPHAIS